MNGDGGGASEISGRLADGRLNFPCCGARLKWRGTNAFRAARDGLAATLSVGLLFMCYQSSLTQFAIQRNGADSNDFVNPATGPDAALGVNAAPVAQQQPLTGAPSAKSFSVANFITMLGGEYFFSPSPAFLATLAAVADRCHAVRYGTNSP